MINPTQEQILKSLAKFHYLSVSQMIQLGISNNRSFLNKQLMGLRKSGKKPLILSQNYGVHPTS